MAISATIYKARLQIADMDRDYYQDFNLTLAQHPSENDERMMVRLLAFILNASEQLDFTKGLSADDEPEVWQKSLSDEIELWIDLGMPDEKRIRKACGRAKQVVIYTYGGAAADIWWQQNAGKMNRFDNLNIVNITTENSKAIAELVKRSMDIQVSIQDGQIWLNADGDTLLVEPVLLYGG